MTPTDKDEDMDDQTAELIEEWRNTCQSMGIPFRMEDAVKFVQGVNALGTPSVDSSRSLPNPNRKDQS